ncbi:hypothetical protein EV356DRAFT_516164 [Viridothelium virens]|uniref:C2H2-type domain-containing protein n=1 Tax=Viridothelium virens TaxID=1048519 RepID=A0A6A6H635_VIRVR|nr:hypothetical protein EV356DRAFT_516164 [Viridothelium virens]
MAALFLKYRIIEAVFYLTLINNALANLPVGDGVKPLLTNQTSGTLSSVDHPSPIQTLCAPDTCGTECSKSFRPPSRKFGHSKIPIEAIRANSTLDDMITHGLQNRTSYPRKRALDPVPAAVADRREHVAALSRYITAEDQWVSYDTRRSLARKTTTSAVEFDEVNARSAFGAKGLTGCTAVLIVSTRGIFGAHIWEFPTFVNSGGRERPDDFFIQEGVDVLFNGSPEEGAGETDIGLDLLTIEGEMMMHGTNPRMFILTPFSNDQDREGGIQTVLRYDRQVNLLAERLQQEEGWVPRIVGYTRRRLIDTTGDRLSRARPYRGFGGRAIFEWDLNERLEEGNRIGKWRLWLEDEMIMEQEFQVDAENLDSESSISENTGF